MAGIWEEVPHDYTTKYQRDFGAVKRAERPRIELTVEESNDIGSKLVKRHLQLGEGANVSKELRATHFSLATDSKTNYLSETKERFRERAEVVHPPKPQSVQPKQNPSDLVFPLFAKKGDPQTYQSAQKLHYQRPADEKAAEARPHQQITVTRANDIGTKVMKQELGPTEIFRSQVVIEDGGANNAPMRQSVTRSHYCDRTQAALHGRRSPAAGIVSRFDHVGHDIVSGRRRLTPTPSRNEPESHALKSRDFRDPMTGMYNILNGKPLV